VKPLVIVRKVPLPQEEAFARITDWERHADAMPATTVRLTDDGFVVRQAIGPVGVDDPMDIVAWDPPRFVRVEKRGRALQGWAEITVDPDAEGSVVTWREVAHVRGVPRILAGLERAAGRRLFGRLLTHLTRS
jgi:carbon monoxide dehydrogenase subunit G